MKKIILIFLPFYVFAGTYDYLKIPFSSKESAILNLFGLFGRSGSALFVNPASIFEMEKIFETGYGNYLIDMHKGFISFPIFKEENPFLSIGIRFLYLGKFTKTDSFGNKIGEYSGENISLGLYFPVLNKYKIGAGFEILYNAIENYSSIGEMVSIGWNFYEKEIKDGLFRNSFIIKNFGFEIKPFHKKRAEFPLRFVYAGGLRFRTFEAGISLFYTLKEGLDGEISYFYRWGKNLKVAISYTTYNRDVGIGESIRDILSGISTGIGIDIKKVYLFYSYTPFGIFGDIHRIDISYRF